MYQLRFLLLGLGLILCSPLLTVSQAQPLDVNVLGLPSQCEATTHNGCSCTGDKTCTKDNKGKTVTCTSNDNSTITCTDDRAGCSCS